MIDLHNYPICLFSDMLNLNYKCISIAYEQLPLTHLRLESGTLENENDAVMLTERCSRVINDTEATDAVVPPCVKSDQ